jgi:WD40 repeat protein
LLTEIRADVPPELARLVCGLMAKDPKDRFQSHAELLQALVPFLPPETRVLSGHTDRVLCLAFSPFGFLLASGSSDQTVKLWAVGNDRELATLSGHKGPVRAVAFSPDGRTLATGTEGRSVRLWDVVRRRKRLSLKGHEGAVRALAFHPDGRILAAAGDDARIRLWDTTTGDEIDVLAGHSDRVQALAFSPCGRWLASGGRDRNVFLWEIGQQRPHRTLSDFPAAVSALAFHRDGKTLAVASQAVHLCPVAAGKKARVLRTPVNILCVAFGPAGDILALGAGSRVLLWAPELGCNPRCLDGHSRHVTGLAFHPEGRLLASAGADGTIRIWQIQVP